MPYLPKSVLPKKEKKGAFLLIAEVHFAELKDDFQVLARQKGNVGEFRSPLNV
jgi:hypothetical protein